MMEWAGFPDGVGLEPSSSKMVRGSPGRSRHRSTPGQRCVVAGPWSWRLWWQVQLRAATEASRASPIQASGIPYSVLPLPPNQLDLGLSSVRWTSFIWPTQHVLPRSGPSTRIPLRGLFSGARAPKQQVNISRLLPAGERLGSIPDRRNESSGGWAQQPGSS